MNIGLCEWLVKHYSKEGDTVLDPLSGSGSTGVVAALNNRDAINVDIEKKFFDYEEESRRKVERQKSLFKRGKIQNILGDSRYLSKYLNSEDVFEDKREGETYLEAMERVYREMFKVLKAGGIACIVVKPFVKKKKVIDLPFDTWRLLEHVGFKLKDIIKFLLPSESFWRILYYKKYPDVEKIEHEYVIVVEKSFGEGNIDSEITSPPYGESSGSVYAGLGDKIDKLFLDGKITKNQYDHFKGRKAYKENAAVSYPKSKGQIAKNKHGDINTVITSPPYADTRMAAGDQEQRKKRLEKAGHKSKNFIAGKSANCKLEDYNDENPNNIGNLSY